MPLVWPRRFELAFDAVTSEAMPGWLVAEAASAPVTAPAIDELHLHFLAFAPHLGDARRVASVLSDEERRRAARLRRTGGSERFVLSHAFARRVLGLYLGVPAPDVALQVDRYGRPSLAGTLRRGDPDLAYSLSHSASHAAVAVAATPWVGVDVEGRRPEVDGLAISRRYLAPEEAAALAALPAEVRPFAFARLWACKEAFVKALGLGLRHPLDRFAVAEVETGRPRFVRIDPPHGPPEEWSLVAAMPAGDCFVAAAARLRNPILRCFAPAVA